MRMAMESPHEDELGETRSRKATRNIIASLAIKGVSVVISFLLVPLTLRYLNPTEYGVWLRN